MERHDGDLCPGCWGAGEAYHTTDYEDDRFELLPCGDCRGTGIYMHGVVRPTPRAIHLAIAAAKRYSSGSKQ